MKDDEYVDRLVEQEIAVSHAVVEGSQPHEPEHDPMSRWVPWVLGATVALAVLCGLAGVVAILLA